MRHAAPLALAALAAAAGLAGCAELPYDPSPSGGVDDGDPSAQRPFHLGGSFTNDRTQEDIDAWCEIARRYDNECVLMESYPEQFLLRFETLGDCTQARNELAAMPRVRPGSCRETTASGEPEVSHRRVLDGRFGP